MCRASVSGILAICAEAALRALLLLLVIREILPSPAAMLLDAILIWQIDRILSVPAARVVRDGEPTAAGVLVTVKVC